MRRGGVVLLLVGSLGIFLGILGTAYGLNG